MILILLLHKLEIGLTGIIISVRSFGTGSKLFFHFNFKTGQSCFSNDLTGLTGSTGTTGTTD
jgi:hypothetical protein